MKEFTKYLSSEITLISDIEYYVNKGWNFESSFYYPVGSGNVILIFSKEV